MIDCPSHFGNHWCISPQVVLDKHNVKDIIKNYYQELQHPKVVVASCNELASQVKVLLEFLLFTRTTNPSTEKKQILAPSCDLYSDGSRVDLDSVQGGLSGLVPTDNALSLVGRHHHVHGFLQELGQGEIQQTMPPRALKLLQSFGERENDMQMILREKDSASLRMSRSRS